MDTGSSADIFIAKALYQMELKDSTLKKASPVYGFASQLIALKGLIIFPVTLGDDEHMVTEMVELQ